MDVHPRAVPPWFSIHRSVGGGSLELHNFLGNVSCALDRAATRRRASGWSCISAGGSSACIACRWRSLAALRSCATYGWMTGSSAELRRLGVVPHRTAIRNVDFGCLWKRRRRAVRWARGRKQR